jgi:drug/metabolite transporter (DMT)-like permease
MSTNPTRTASPGMVILAFATVYIVWGSTYFFIQKAIEHMPALLMGAIRFIAAGGILLAWCIIKGEKVWDVKQMRPAIVSGLLMLFVGNGTLIWAEKSLPSSLAAVLVSATPIWFVLLDKPQWGINFNNRSTITGLIIGFLGIILLFSEQTSRALGNEDTVQVAGLVILIIGSISWAAGSLFSKYKVSGSAMVNTTWQMLAAGIAFIPGSLLNNEWDGFAWSAVTLSSWLSVAYLIIFGSLIGYSAYVWLLSVRPVAQVSTYAYVNPVVAVLLGVFFAGEHMTFLQIAGLAIILLSVLLINLAKYRKEKKAISRQSARKPVVLPATKAEV